MILGEWIEDGIYMALKNDSSGNNERLDILVFIPTKSCACNFAGFMNRIFSAIVPYKSKINMDIKDIESEDAEKYGIRGNSIVIPQPPNEKKPKILKTALQLKHFLRNLYGF